MEATLMASSSSVAQRTLFFQSPRSHGFSSRRHSSSASDAFQTNSPVDRRNGRGLVVTGAKKRNKKVDSHSFAPRPDESTGPFPEAVLLKKKVVKEDGRVLPEFADDEEENLFEFLSLQLESDLNLERMRHYEVVYLIHEDHVDEVDTVISKVQEFIREKKGRIWRLNNWGLRRLAYKIRKATHANYVLMNYELDAKFINDFKSMLDKDERIIRHLVMKRDEAITENCPPPPEFHTLHAQQGAVDEDFDSEGEVEDEDWGDDEMELEMAGQDDFDNEADANIIIVDADSENDRDDGTGRRARILKNYEGIKVVF
ncbi:protein REGULATOR OF FATTY ACID COMPOSITION 3, chloroplastic-like isoform X2 [Musa acuminata AAA Group]|uniref:protein REGULATOR OF FATTY ACID COMPOSITION 3, chloroplastic-like isoform X2 n=1 Tax=Musa acuminata AAA Group TaxID=214697 RepID=UPI0031CE053F